MTKYRCALLVLLTISLTAQVRAAAVGTNAVAGETTVGTTVYPAGGMHCVGNYCAYNENNLTTSFVDWANGYAYFGTSNDHAVLIKVRLSDLSRVDSIPVGVGNEKIVASVVDTAGGFAYVATYSKRVYRLRLSDFTWAGVLDVDGRSALIDVSGGYAYFGGSRNTITRVRLSDFSVAGILTLDAGETRLFTAVLDPVAGFAYFGTYNAPSVIVKVRLSDFSRVAAIPLNSGENYMCCAAIDAKGMFAYFGTANTYPGIIIKINLTDFTRADSLVLNAGENSIGTALIDPAGEYAYFGTSFGPSDVTVAASAVIKVRLSDFKRVASLVLNDKEAYLESGFIDPAGEFAYLGTCTTPGRVVKINLSDFSRSNALTLRLGMQDVCYSALDPIHSCAYFLAHDTPNHLLKLSLPDLKYLDGWLLDAWCMAIDSGAGFLYVATWDSPPHVLKLRLTDMAVTGDLVLNTDEKKPNNILIDQVGGALYVTTGDTKPIVIKIRLSDFSRVGAITLTPYYEGVNCAAIDPARDFAYFSTPKLGMFKLRLSIFALASRLDNGYREYSMYGPVIDPVHGNLYFLTNYIPTNTEYYSRLVKVRESDMTRVDCRNFAEMSGGCGAVDAAGAFAYFGGSQADHMVVTKIKLSNFTESAVLKTQNQYGPNTSFYFNGFVYFASNNNTGRIDKLAVSYKNEIHATKMTMPTYGDVSDVRFYSHKAGGNLRLGIYDDGFPRKLLWQSASTSNTLSGGWVTIPIGSGAPKKLTLPNGMYWLAWQSDSATDVPGYTPGAADGEFFMSYGYAGFPTSIEASNTASSMGMWSEYLTYTVRKNAAAGWTCYH